MPSLTLLLSPLFGAIIIGIFAGARNLFDQDDARRFARFVFLIAMPVAAFSFMSSSAVFDVAYMGMIVGYLLSFCLIAGLTFVLARTLGKLSIRESGAVVFATTCGNAVFLGLPIALMVPGWGPPFLVLMVCEGILVFAAGTALMTWPDGSDGEAKGVILRSLGSAAVRAVQNPIVVGTALGALIAFIGVSLPPVLAGPVGVFAKIASPMGLFVLGLYLTILPKASSEGRVPKRLLGISLPIKLVAFPLLSFGLVYLFTRDLHLAKMGAFFTGLPPAVASIMYAATYRQLERGVAAIVGIGTVVGLVTATAFLALTLGS